MTRNNEPSYREKGRAVVLAALMVMSVVAMSAAFVGGAAANHEDTDVQVPDEDNRLWAGQTGVFSVSTGDSVDLYEGGADDDGEWIREVSVEDNEVTIDTEDLETGTYFLDADSDSDDQEFEVRVQNLDGTGFAADSVVDDSAGNSEAELNIESNRATFNTSVSAEGLDVDDLESIFDDDDIIANSSEHDDEEFVVLNSNDSFNANFSGIDTGEYEFQFDVTDSAAQTTDTITVEEYVEADTDVWFAGDEFSESQGDVLTFDLGLQNAQEINGDTVWVTVSGDGYEAELEIAITDEFEGDTATIAMDTFAAGQNTDNTDDAFTSQTDGISVENVDQDDIGNNRLATGTYAANVYENEEANGELQNRNDVTTLLIEDRHTGDAGTSIAPSGSYDDSEGLDSIEQITSSNEVAQNDTLVFDIDVSGVEYAVDAENNKFSNGVNLTFTNDDVGAYEDSISFNASDITSGFSLVSDSENDTVYAIVDLDDLEVDDSSAANFEDDDEVSVDDEWDTVFEIDGDVNPYVADGETETAETSFTVLEEQVNLDYTELPYDLTPSENATITGTTTLAPGSTVSVEVEMAGVFLDDEDITVDSDRTWSFTEDYSERQVGDEFTITVDGTEYDGVFSETHEDDTSASNEQLNELLEQYDVNNVDELEAFIAGLESENANLSDKVDELESENEDLQNDSAALQDLLDKTDTESADELKDHLDSLESDNAELSDENANLSDEVSSLEDEVADLESQLENNETDDTGSDDTSGDGNESDDGDSDDGTPGFGVAVAAIALLAAAMLALRRQH